VFRSFGMRVTGVVSGLVFLSPACPARTAGRGHAAGCSCFLRICPCRADAGAAGCSTIMTLVFPGYPRWVWEGGNTGRATTTSAKHQRCYNAQNCNQIIVPKCESGIPDAVCPVREPVGTLVREGRFTAEQPLPDVGGMHARAGCRIRCGSIHAGFACQGLLFVPGSAPIGAEPGTNRWAPGAAWTQPAARPKRST
jgi:hypothetical protein